ncbi:MAG: replication-associated recombination protein A [Bacilli bacterium]|nr:replication-associated recombination protein A [Bacilli bacterium]
MELLANKIRPEKIKDIVGQDSLVGSDGIITKMIKNKKLFSMILYGNPGTGKTSLANAISKELDYHVRFLNAAIDKKEDFIGAINEAKLYGEIVLIIDEIHRMNKDKQDILLPSLESGLVILIGLTTTNPYHTINPAIRSRVLLLELKPLNNNDIKKALKRVIKSLENIKISDKVLEYIVNVSNGDLRSAITLLEIAYTTSNDHNITLELVEKINAKPMYFHDKNETDFYNLLSALQKSIRGSDVDASLHYLARLIYFDDFDSIYRRLTVIAYEDIGLANSGIGPKLHAAIEASKMVGMPECLIILGNIVTEMALSPKSNSTHDAILSAYDDVLKGNIGDIPENIKIAANGYLYPHNYKNSWVKQNYMPDKLKNKKYYIPKDNKLENNINNIRKEMEK